LALQGGTLLGAGHGVGPVLIRYYNRGSLVLFEYY